MESRRIDYYPAGKAEGLTICRLRLQFVATPFIAAVDPSHPRQLIAVRKRHAVIDSLCLEAFHQTMTVNNPR